MKKTLSFENVWDEFVAYDRAEQFSYEGLQVLFNYLEELEESCGIEIELDVIAICCEYSEYKNFEELQEDYDVENIRELEENTEVLSVGTHGIIVRAY